MHCGGALWSHGRHGCVAIQLRGLFLMKATTSFTEQITETGSQIHRNGIDYPANFQNKTPCADFQLYKNEKLPDQRQKAPLLKRSRYDAVRRAE